MQINEGEWNHIALSYDGSELVIYINGIKTVLDNNLSGTFDAT